MATTDEGRHRPRQLADARWDEVYGAIKSLKPKGAKSIVVRTHATELLELACVRERVPDEPGNKVLAQAAIDLLGVIVNTELAEQPFGTICKIILGLQEVYVDLEGQDHRLLELKLSERRELAGLEIFEGDDSVKAGTIRTYWEPRAFTALTAHLLRREISITGRKQEDGSFNRDIDELLQERIARAEGDLENLA
jgi:hypothetical protein